MEHADNGESAEAQLLQYYEYELRIMNDEKKKTNHLLEQHAATIAELTKTNEEWNKKYIADIAALSKKHALQMAETIERLENESQRTIAAIRMAHEGMISRTIKKNRELEEEICQLRQRNY